MNILKGLIIKDLLQLKSYKKTLIMFIMIFLITSLTQENVEDVSMLIIMLTLGFGMFSIATFNYDEQAKADRYILTLPLTKKDIVLSKYILVICSTIVGAILGMIASFVIIFAMSKEMVNIKDMISLGLGGILGIGIVEAIQIPCIYKWGAERGRIQLLIVVAIITLLVGGLFFLGDKMNINLEENCVMDMLSNFLPIILVAITAIIYYFSYKVSYKIYSKKEI